MRFAEQPDWKPLGRWARVIFVVVGATLGFLGARYVLVDALRLLATARLPYLVGALAIIGAANAVVLVELLRIAVPRVARWSHANHFRLIAIVWVILFVASLSGALLMRQSLGLRGP